MQRLKNIIRKILRGFYYLITSPRLTFLLFQVRFIERYFKIDFFLFPPNFTLKNTGNDFFVKNNNEYKFN